MITKLKVSNFKSLRELECEFGRLTVIVGPNGCGKSSVLQAIKAVRDLVVDPRYDVNATPLSRPAQGDAPKSFEFEMHFESLILDGAITPGHSQPRRFKVRHSKDETWVLEGQGHYSSFAKLLVNIALYQLDKTIMERSTFSSESRPQLGYRGEDLASVLDAVLVEQREQFEAIEAGLRKFIPGLRRVRLQRVSELHQPRIGHQVLLDFEFARNVTANHASEGTVLLLGLLTVIGVEPGPPMTIMLDDLDRGLHPKAQKQLIEHLRQLLDSRPDLQIIATTHSPYLVEHLKYEEVLAMTQSPEDGRSLIAPLAKHPDADRWREEMSAGEFWSSVGEDWIAGE